MAKIPKKEYPERSAKQRLTGLVSDMATSRDSWPYGPMSTNTPTPAVSRDEQATSKRLGNIFRGARIGPDEVELVAVFIHESVAL